MHYIFNYTLTKILVCFCFAIGGRCTFFTYSMHDTHMHIQHTQELRRISTCSSTKFSDLE